MSYFVHISRVTVYQLTDSGHEELRKSACERQLGETNLSVDASVLIWTADIKEDLDGMPVPAETVLPASSPSPSDMLFSSYQ